MPKKIAPSQGLPYGWIRGEDYWGGPMSESQIFLDSMTWPVIRSLTYSAPPSDAVDGSKYVVAANPTGLWAGHEGALAVLVEGTWVFYPPKLGWRAYAESYNRFIWYNGTTWVAEDSGDDPVNPDPDPTVKPKWYDLAVTVSDSLLADEPFVHVPILDPAYLPANLAGSQLDMANGASGYYAQFRIQRNGSNVGVMTIEQGAYGATFSTAGGNPVSFAKGDRLTVRGPQTAVNGLKNFGFVIRLGLL